MEENLKQHSSPNLLRVVLFGPESTGKTTLAQLLAAHFNTVWVPEYMRSYFEKKWQGQKGTSVIEDLIPIAKGQMALENELARKANRILFCDTDLLELKVYSEYYFEGFCPPEITKSAFENRYDFYFLMYIDTPWQPDNLRDKPTERKLMFAAFEKALQEAGKPYAVLKGTKDERLKKAIRIVEEIMQ